MSDPLKRLARRVENDPSFLACLLDEYARAEGLDDAALARELGCQPADLTGVRLCRAPRADPASFRDDVRQVAQRFALPLDRFLEIVRQGEALCRLRGGAADPAGFLMAARDPPDDSPPPTEGKAP